MDPITLDKVQLILGLVSMAMQYGIPAVVNAAQALNKTEITLEDMEVLRTLVRPPEEY